LRSVVEIILAPLSPMLLDERSNRVKEIDKSAVEIKLALLSPIGDIIELKEECS